MKITDEMFAAARKAYLDGGGDLRAALEAALGARGGDASKFVKELRDSAYWQSNEDYAKAAACIEDLAGALNYMIQTQEAWEEDVSKIIQRPPNIFNRAIDRARATLERWGLK